MEYYLPIKRNEGNLSYSDLRGIFLNEKKQGGESMKVFHHVAGKGGKGNNPTVYSCVY